MSEPTDRKLAADTAQHVEAVRGELHIRMTALGLTRTKGWDVLERVVDRPNGGAIWVFIPVYREETPPAGLGAAVAIDADGRVVT